MNLNEISRSAHPAKILAVSKLQTLDKIRNLYTDGQRLFAENYIQEAVEKIEQLSDLNDIQWHLIGNIQKNKIKFILGKFHLIHSIDSLSLLEALSKKCVEADVEQNILLQVNIAQEKSKGGFNEDNLFLEWNRICSFKNLHIFGFMTMPPLTDNPENVRPYFRRLKEIQNELRQATDLTTHPLQELSMGTSGDYLVAKQEGATIVRLGTILFGERPSKG